MFLVFCTRTKIYGSAERFRVIRAPLSFRRCNLVLLLLTATMEMEEIDKWSNLPNIPEFIIIPVGLNTNGLQSVSITNPPTLYTSYDYELSTREADDVKPKAKSTLVDSYAHNLRTSLNT